MIMEHMNGISKTEYVPGALNCAARMQGQMTGARSQMTGTQREAARELKEVTGAQGKIADSRGDKTRRIGIMGGTFNPIHNGHLIIAEDVREKAGLDKVLFIPSGQPPHKPGYEVADAEHRFEMVRRAVSSNRHFEVSRIEVDRNGPTYTVNTLLELREKYSEETTFYFIIGADVVPELVTWREYEKVFCLCDFVAVMRPGFDESEFSGAIRRLSEEKGTRINPVQSHLIGISSTDIRERCRTGRSIKYLVPESVEEYISEKGLYRG
jgi:nicotinate-nucleotide adenylyltransferase